MPTLFDTHADEFINELEIFVEKKYEMFQAMNATNTKENREQAVALSKEVALAREELKIELIKMQRTGVEAHEGLLAAERKLAKVRELVSG